MIFISNVVILGHPLSFKKHILDLGKGSKKKKEKKKLTNVSFMYVCVAGNGEMLVFFSFFPPTILFQSRGFEPYGAVSWSQGAVSTHTPLPVWPQVTWDNILFFCFCTFFKIFHVRLGKKTKNVSFY